ncbi:unnamed protein product [Brassica napus]|uniref:(rape) hypothetical protein n=1 Tax=Brassica napus TaxID=3708 RepID=A0A816I4N9_BRANA|nr:unnamed protein product [Brassica napus]
MATAGSYVFFFFSSESLLLIVVSPFVFCGCLRCGDDPDPVQIQNLLASGSDLGDVST